MRRKVFISHCEEDFVLAREICRRIERRGVSCWIAPRDIVVGEDYARRLSDAINEAAAFIVVLSRVTNASRFVKAEVERAFNAQVPIFPVRIEKVDPEGGLEFFLSINHRVDAFGMARPKALDHLAEAVIAKVKSGGPRDIGKPSGNGRETHDLARAIGPGAMDFIAQWRRMDAAKAPLAWSWEALLGGPFWPFYRGMVNTGIVLAAIVAVTIALGGAIGGANGALTGFAIGWVLTALYVGLTGSVALRRHVRRHVADGPMNGTAKFAFAGVGALILLGGFAAGSLERPLLPVEHRSVSPAETIATNTATPVAERRDAVTDPRREEEAKATNDIGLIVVGALLEKQRAQEEARQQASDQANMQMTDTIADNAM